MTGRKTQNPGRQGDWCALLAPILFLLLGLFLTVPALSARAAEKTAESTGKAISSDAVIPDGISIQGTDVSGKTEKEAEETVNARVQELGTKQITLKAGDRSITASAGELGLKASNDAARQAVNYGKKGNPAERFLNQKKRKHGKNLQISVTADADTLTQYLQTHSSEITTPAVNNGLSHENGVFTYVKGKKGTELDLEGSVSQIRSYLEAGLNQKSSEITLPTRSTKPKGSKKELETVKDLLGTFTTDYSGSTDARKTNVARAASFMNGKILYPGDTISVYQTCAPLTAANGYATAAAYAGGEVVTAEGGGVCQVSTTTYNAALLAELAIETRSAHSMPVHYVPYSFDAAIASSSDGSQVLMDLQFRNNKTEPVYIEELTNGSTITVSIYGKETRPANRTVSFDNHLTGETPAKNKYKADETLPAGTFQKTKSGSTGYNYQLIKTVTVDGAVESTKVQNISNYQEVDSEYTVGVASDDPAVTAALKSAVATGDDQTVMNAIQQYAGVSVRPTTLQSEGQLKALKDVAEANPDDKKAQKAYDDAKAAADVARTQAAQSHTSQQA